MTYRFMRSPKWLFGHALVLLVVVAFTNFGFWQVRRLDEVRTHNAHVSEQLTEDPVSLAEALEEGAPYTRVATEGEFLAEAQLLTAPRPRDGSPGHHVLTPLATPDGTVLVDRGWVPFDRDGTPDRALAPPGDKVEVRGLLVPAEEGSPGEAEHLRTIDPGEVSHRTGVDLTPGYLQLQDAEPAGQGGPLPHADPVLDEGNHLSYAVQWFLFTGVVLVGYPILLRHTARGGGPDTDPDGPGGGLPSPGIQGRDHDGARPAGS